MNQHSETRYKSRGIRALEVAQDHVARRGETELQHALESNKRIAFVAGFDECSECYWSPSIDVAMELISIANGSVGERVMIRHPLADRSQFASDTQKGGRSSRARIENMARGLDSNPQAGHVLVWHVPGDDFVSVHHSSPAIRAYALEDLARAIHDSVEQWLHFEFPLKLSSPAP